MHLERVGISTGCEQSAIALGRVEALFVTCSAILTEETACQRRRAASWRAGAWRLSLAPSSTRTTCSPARAAAWPSGQPAQAQTPWSTGTPVRVCTSP